MAVHSGKLLDELVPSIKRTAELVHEVTAASQEQSAGVAQINRVMAEVDQVTQRNATAAEELSSTAEELAAQSATLLQIMNYFKVSGDDSAAALAARRHGQDAWSESELRQPALRSRMLAANPNGKTEAETASFSRF